MTTHFICYHHDEDYICEVADGHYVDIHRLRLDEDFLCRLYICTSNSAYNIYLAADLTPADITYLKLMGITCVELDADPWINAIAHPVNDFTILDIPEHICQQITDDLYP